MKNRISWVVLITLLLFIVSCKKTDKASGGDFNFNDPTYVNLEKKVQSIPFLFQSDTNKLYARILQSKNKHPKPTVIFLHGNPGFEKNEDICQALRRNGYNAVFFSYTGTWGNPGIFSFNQSISDTKNLVAYLKANSNKLRIDVSQLYLCGFSMGADIALLSSVELQSQIKGVIAIDPWGGFQWLNAKNENALQQYQKALEHRPGINIPNGEDFTNDITQNEKSNLKKLNLNNSNALFIFSNTRNKKDFFASVIENKFKTIVIESVDHSFSDKRVELSIKIYNWISDQRKQ